MRYAVLGVSLGDRFFINLYELQASTLMQTPIDMGCQELPTALAVRLMALECGGMARLQFEECGAEFWVDVDPMLIDMRYAWRDDPCPPPVIPKLFSGGKTLVATPRGLRWLTPEQVKALARGEDPTDDFPDAGDMPGDLPYNRPPGPGLCPT